MERLHLMTQDNQPYGSARYCCERCGIMLGFHASETWTDNRAVFAAPPTGYVRCDEREGE